MSRCESWDIFCTVVDNFGDIGVCWRLARQLANEHQRSVRLWVDDLDSFTRIAPSIDPTLAMQSHGGVDVRRWATPFPEVDPCGVVIEAFACHIPDAYITRMAASASKPAWINLEYLSAEKWAMESHRLPSPHPQLPLTKYFFFPGFAENTGGLLRRRDLISRRDAFQHSEAAQAAFWSGLGVAPRAAGETRISLFSYANSALPGLLDAWAAAGAPITCVVPEGPLAQSLAPSLGGGRHLARGNLAVQVLPFVEQDEYDKLLWACDVNFVRGEDSFVSAQWAARPFVWHIYPQEEDVHLPKLEVFLDLYTAGLEARTSARIKYLWHTWNRNAETGASWQDFWSAKDALQAHARDWASRLAIQTDLAARLVNFCDNLL